MFLHRHLPHAYALNMWYVLSSVFCAVGGDFQNSFPDVLELLLLLEVLGKQVKVCLVILTLVGNGEN